MRGNIIKKRLITFAFEKTTRISLGVRVVLVQCQEFDTGLFIDLRKMYV